MAETLDGIPGARKDLPLVQVDVGLLAHQVGIPATDTLDLGEGVHDLLLAIDVGVEKTQNELKVRLFARNQSWNTSLVQLYMHGHIIMTYT